MGTIWSAGVFSSGSDVEEHRKALVSRLKEAGFSAFSYKSNESHTSVDSLSPCSMIPSDKTDIVIFLVGNKCTSKFCGVDEDKSAFTVEREVLQETIKSGAPIYTFAIRDSFDECDSYEKEYKSFRERKKIKTKNPKRYSEMKLEFDKEYVCKYVENTDTIHWIEAIKAVCTIDTFSDIEGLLSAVERRLNDYTWQVLRQIGRKQEEKLLSRKTSTALGMSLRDVFESGYYVEPPFNVDSGETLVSKTGGDLCSSIWSVMQSNKSVLIYGEAGYGKTTILAKCFSNHLNSMNNDISEPLPLFLPLLNKGKEFDFDITKYVNDDMLELLQKDPYPYLDLKSVRLRLYCDGFDELAETLDECDIEKIVNSSIFKHPMLLTCRQLFTTRYLCVYNFSDVFSVRIQMKRWDLSIIERYISNTYKSNGRKNSECKELIQKFRENRDDLKSLIDSPLLLSMFLYYLKEECSYNYASVTRADLFKWCIDMLSKREHKRERGITSERIKRVWEKTSWLIYLSRINNEKIHKDDLFESLKEEGIDGQWEQITSTFDAIFVWKGDCINGTFHEQFMEYMVARLFVTATRNDESPFPEFLRYVTRPEINRLFRDIWSDEPRMDRNKVYETMSKLYFDTIGDDDESSIATRVHAIYHLCRLNAGKRSDIIKRAYKVESNMAVLLSLYFGAVKLGQLDKEEEFYQYLQDSCWSKANRGYHLTYYGDVIQKGSLPYYDDEESEWQGTFNAFRRHFSSQEEGHYYLRRIDLYTMRELISARENVSPLTDEDMEFFLSKIGESENEKQKDKRQYNEKVMNEYKKLSEVYSNLSKKTDEPYSFIVYEKGSGEIEHVIDVDPYKKETQEDETSSMCTGEIKTREIDSERKVSVGFSYAWESKEHNEKVMRLCKSLRDRGYEAEMDTKVSQEETAIDFQKMMEDLTNKDKVVVVLSEKYKEKAENRSGGVGKEFGLILTDIEKKPTKYILVTFDSLKSGAMDRIRPKALLNREVIEMSDNNPEWQEKMLAKLSDTLLYDYGDVAEKMTIPVTKKVNSLF